ncbi:universal stress protein [Lentzea aerocolonigenes]|uniref:universal stress protein n=1 Tax=Lentzea aerocolonigenes TaxID=68170 RepID=UPI0031F8F472
MSRRRWTSRCSAAITSGSPTTRCPLPSGSRSRSAPADDLVRGLPVTGRPKAPREPSRSALSSVPGEEDVRFTSKGPGAPVVAGVDGSVSALDAVAWAADECVRHNAPLRLAHAYLPPMPSRADLGAAAGHIDVARFHGRDARAPRAVPPRGGPAAAVTADALQRASVRLVHAVPTRRCSTVTSASRRAGATSTLRHVQAAHQGPSARTGVLRTGSPATGMCRRSIWSLEHFCS